MNPGTKVTRKGSMPTMTMIPTRNGDGLVKIIAPSKAALAQPSHFALIGIMPKRWMIWFGKSEAKARKIAE
jgi:hypothetical protein